MIGDILPEILAECGLDVSDPQIGSADFQMRQFAALVNAAGRDINSRAEWSKSRKQTDLGPGSIFNLPNDFQEMASTGAVTIGGKPARAVPSTEMWQLLKAKPSAQPYYHLEGGQIHFSPAITLADIQYISKGWLENGSISATDNADIPVFPDELLKRGVIWRWRRQKGLPFDDLIAEFEADLEVAIKADRGVA